MFCCIHFCSRKKSTNLSNCFTDFSPISSIFPALFQYFLTIFQPPLQVCRAGSNLGMLGCNACQTVAQVQRYVFLNNQLPVVDHFGKLNLTSHNTPIPVIFSKAKNKACIMILVMFFLSYFCKYNMVASQISRSQKEFSFFSSGKLRGSAVAGSWQIPPLNTNMELHEGTLEEDINRFWDVVGGFLTWNPQNLAVK